jgi:hypothetical protein
MTCQARDNHDMEGHSCSHRRAGLGRPFGVFHHVRRPLACRIGATKCARPSLSSAARCRFSEMRAGRRFSDREARPAGTIRPDQTGDPKASIWQPKHRSGNEDMAFPSTRPAGTVKHGVLPARASRRKRVRAGSAADPIRASRFTPTRHARATAARLSPRGPRLDHDDLGSNRSKVMNVIDSENVERDRQIRLRNLRELDCVGKPVPTFPRPALERFPAIRTPVRVVKMRENKKERRSGSTGPDGARDPVHGPDLPAFRTIPLQMTFRARRHRPLPLPTYLFGSFEDKGEARTGSRRVTHAQQNAHRRIPSRGDPGGRPARKSCRRIRLRIRRQEAASR